MLFPLWSNCRAGQEYHQRVEQEEQEQRRLARLEAVEERSLPLSLPEQIRRRPQGQALSPRSQDEVLHALGMEVGLTWFAKPCEPFGACLNRA